MVSHRLAFPIGAFDAQAGDANPVPSAPEHRMTIAPGREESGSGGSIQSTCPGECHLLRNGHILVAGEVYLDPIGHKHDLTGLGFFQRRQQLVEVSDGVVTRGKYVRVALAAAYRVAGGVRLTAEGLVSVLGQSERTAEDHQRQHHATVADQIHTPTLLSCATISSVRDRLAVHELYPFFLRLLLRPMHIAVNAGVGG